MVDEKVMDRVRQYFEGALVKHGATPRGADWNSNDSQDARFDQLVKVIGEKRGFSLLDYGSGYGALARYLLERDYQFDQYYGFDILEPMVVEGRKVFEGQSSIVFTSNLMDVPQVDYTVASGVFNFRADATLEDWTAFTVRSLDDVNRISRKGFSCNFLTKYSDADRMRADLYYADPCYLFDYCKTHYSKNVALLHDYNLYDFTIIVRK